MAQPALTTPLNRQQLCVALRAPCGAPELLLEDFRSVEQAAT